ncbi:MAG: hypothetical protein KAJ49_03915 [Arcobacteraceae bacterium]|nr:hypothetical protein [Arcobacteraceae bacterium]
MKKTILTLTTLATLAFGSISVNDNMGNFSSIDQFDKVHTVTTSTKQMIFAFKKASGHTMKEFLGTKPIDYLTSKNILFVADVSAMPTIIQWFALPSLKDYPFPIVVLNDDELSAQYKDEENIEKIMVIILKNKIVSEIKYFNDTKELEKYLEK